MCSGSCLNVGGVGRQSAKTLVRSILFGDTMVPNIEYDYVLLLGYGMLYREEYLTGFNHQKNRYPCVQGGSRLGKHQRTWQVT